MYLQITEKKSSLEKIKNSKFLGFCHTVYSNEEAHEIINNYNEEYKKANHVCWAYRILTTQDVPGYSSDAGEPGRSAGPPILSAIEGRNLVNTLVIVVRYFGGIKLGVGGLIRAYGGVAGRLLDQTKTKELVKHVTIEINTPHKNYSDVMFIMEQTGVKFTQEYGVKGAVLSVVLPESEKDEMIVRFNPFPQVTVKIK